MKGSIRIVKYGGAAVVLLGAQELAMAQTAQPLPSNSGSIVEEVVVNARRVSESLHDAPAAITVLSAETITNAGVQGLGDVVKLVPNLSFMPAWRQGVFNLAARGVPTIQGGEPSVAVLVDGVQAPGPDFINQDLLDIQSIEVLRGPQGALYGRGAINGALLIYTVDPTTTLEDRLVIRAGNGDTVNVTNTLRGPITDDLGFSLTTALRDTEGLIDDRGLGRPGDHSKQGAVRAKFVYTPSDATRIDWALSYVNGKDGASYLAAVPLDRIDDESNLPARNLDTTDDRELYSTSLKIEQDVGMGTLTSISQYAKATSLVLGDFDFTPAPAIRQRVDTTVSAFNQDLRLASAADSGVRWLFGGFYQYRLTRDGFFVDGDPAGPLAGVILANGKNRARSEAYAVYAQLELDLPADFRLSTALRYDADRRRDEDRLVTNSAVSHTFTATQPQVTLSRKFGPDVNAYATVGRGFRSGGFNAFLDASILGVPRLYAAEETTNYELGLKTQFFEQRLILNTAVFHTQFDGEQINVFSLTPPARTIVNFDSKIDGGEVELTAVPLRGLTLSAAIGVHKGNIETGPFRGQRPPGSHESTVHASVQYEFALAPDWSAVARVDYKRFGEVFYDPANTAGFDSAQLVDAYVRLDHGRFGIAVWGNNLFDEYMPAVYVADTLGPGVGVLQRNQPVSYGVELSLRF